MDQSSAPPTLNEQVHRDRCSCALSALPVKGLGRLATAALGRDCGGAGRGCPPATAAGQNRRRPRSCAQPPMPIVVLPATRSFAELQPKQ